MEVPLFSFHSSLSLVKFTHTQETSLLSALLVRVVHGFEAHRVIFTSNIVPQFIKNEIPNMSKTDTQRPVIPSLLRFAVWTPSHMQIHHLLLDFFPICDFPGSEECSAETFMKNASECRSWFKMLFIVNRTIYSLCRVLKCCSTQALQGAFYRRPKYKIQIQNKRYTHKCKSNEVFCWSI